MPAAASARPSRFDRVFPPPPGGQPLAAKVPAITVTFWVLKLLTTGMGEAMSDFMGQVSVPAAGLIGVGGFVYALRRQLRATEYHAPTYWAAVMMLAVFGTMVADGLKDGAGLSYAVTTPLFVAIVAVLFVRWRRAEGTLSIHSITTRSRELHYWGAVLATFALGTAAGDLTAIQLHIGFFGSVALFGVAIALPAVAWRLGVSPILAFWVAYVITRPLGASIVDGFSKPVNASGLGLGDGPVSGVALLVFVALVVWTARTRRDIQGPDDEDPHGPAGGAPRLRAHPVPAGA